MLILSGARRTGTNGQRSAVAAWVWSSHVALTRGHATRAELRRHTSIEAKIRVIRNTNLRTADNAEIADSENLRLSRGPSAS